MFIRKISKVVDFQGVFCLKEITEKGKQADRKNHLHGVKTPILSAGMFLEWSYEMAHLLTIQLVHSYNNCYLSRQSKYFFPNLKNNYSTKNYV